MGHLLKMLESQQAGAIITTIQCGFSLVPDVHPTQNEMVLILKDIVGDFQSHLYMCHDSDVFVVWNGGSTKTINAVKEALMKHFPKIFKTIPPDMFFRYFDFRAHGEELRIACRKKRTEEIKHIASESSKTPDHPDWAELAQLESGERTGNEFVIRIFDKKYIQVNDAFFDMYRTAAPFRNARKTPKFLIIEDQAFASRMLSRIIGDIGEPISAPNGEEGLLLYAMHVPDIVFIDIELPDSSGHQLAEFIREFDTEAYIVMVTANHSSQDIKMAMKNKVQDYMAKPYTLKKVQTVMGKFKKRKKS